MMLRKQDEASKHFMVDTVHFYRIRIEAHGTLEIFGKPLTIDDLGITARATVHIPCHFSFRILIDF